MQFLQQINHLLATLHRPCPINRFVPNRTTISTTLVWDRFRPGTLSCFLDWRMTWLFPPIYSFPFLRLHWTFSLILYWYLLFFRLICPFGIHASQTTPPCLFRARPQPKTCSNQCCFVCWGNWRTWTRKRWRCLTLGRLWWVPLAKPVWPRCYTRKHLSFCALSD